MAMIDFYVPEGCWAALSPHHLEFNQTFGTCGAGDSQGLILLVIQHNGTLGCGHLTCQNFHSTEQQTDVIQQTYKQLNTCLSHEDRTAPYYITHHCDHITTKWMKFAVTRWFEHPYVQNSSHNSAGYFVKKESGDISVMLGNEIQANPVCTNHTSLHIELA